MTREVALRIERAIAVATESRTARIRTLEGNPLGVEVRTWGHVVGVQVRRGPWYYPFFNAISGLVPGDAAALDDALAWYRAHGLRARVSVSPFLADEAWLRQLADRGLELTEFMSVLFGVPEPGEPSPAERVAVRECPDLDDFLTVWLASAEEAEREALKPIVRAEFAEWRCYVARVGAEAAGVGALHVRGGVGFLAAGATLPHFRNRGCQTALLRRRIADAAAAGCDLVVSQARPGSASQRNMERVGLRTAYTKIDLVDRP